MKSQMQMQMQNEQQAIDQGFSHDILFQLLSTAELFALGNVSNRKFKGYEYFNCSAKSRPKLKEQFLMQTDIFKNSYIFFCHDHESYDFPSNLSRETIVTLMEYWKSMVDNIKEKEIYDKTIKLLTKDKTYGPIKIGGNKINSSNKDLNDTEMGNLQDIMTGLNYSNQKLSENIKKKINPAGKYSGEANLGANGPVDPVLAGFHDSGNISMKKKGKSYVKKEDESYI